MPLSSITAVCIDTQNHRMALPACRAMLSAGLGSVVFVTDATGIELARQSGLCADGRFRVDEIKPITSTADYSRYVLRHLKDHFDTEFVLVFQWDGFVADAAQWRGHFLEYDYIGAPWASVTAGNRSHPVGNGGFSLRSRKLVEALMQMDLPDSDRPEDQRICIDLADALQSRFGIRFAPLDVAKQFSVEIGALPWSVEKDAEWFAPSFGFHGWFNLHRVYSDADLLTIVDKLMNRDDVASLLASWKTPALMTNLYAQGRHEVVAQLSRRVAPLIGLDEDHGLTNRQFIHTHFWRLDQKQRKKNRIQTVLQRFGLRKIKARSPDRASHHSDALDAAGA